ncbi:50S ribosomal protein L13 [Candidatus Woesebacteria bacterium]|nr:50S ribosomal protein L13 [Candidatus Woesebacteria bacterium]
MITKTYQPKAKEIKRAWHLIDAKDKILGRVSTQIATILMGKNKVAYSGHMDSGDYVVVINAEKVKVTGKKLLQKLYRRHSGYPGGFREVTLEKLLQTHPERAIEHAVSGMLPDNRIKRQRMARLKVLAGEVNLYKDNIKEVIQNG